jgi:hypothetical protein
MPSLTVFHQCTVQLGVRKPSLHIILLNFDAIAGEFFSLRRCPVPERAGDSQPCTKIPKYRYVALNFIANGCGVRQAG